jgi:D-alanyl-D-alanine carboxypeptidase/D-alanyl-D-alanine-endopeptidase (penicillin-binding protein 4)
MSRKLILYFSIFVVLNFSSSASDFNKEVKSQLDLIFSDPSFERAFWGVKVVSIDSGEILYQKNPDKLFMPASNMKLITSIAAIENFGLDYTFRTEVLSDGRIEDGTLKGDLVIRGSGDPLIGARLNSPDSLNALKGNPLAVFENWAEQLNDLGIRRIEGNIVGDDDLMDDEPLGNGWTWDNLPYGYSAEIGALQFNENIVWIELSTGRNAGEPVRYRLIPETDYLEVKVEIETVGETDEWEVEIERGVNNKFTFKGTMPVNIQSDVLSIAIQNPTSFFIHVLHETLEKKGINVKGVPIDRDDLKNFANREYQTLFVHESPPLRKILTILLKNSQNLYAETLFKLLDRGDSQKSFENGLGFVESFLTRIGIPDDAYNISDASGLSRYNLLTPDLLIRLLQYSYRTEYREDFIDMLPIGGVDGTIRNRMKRTSAESNVRAKTGSISFVRALSGFVETQDGEVLAFSMIANHFTQSRRTAEYIQDSALHYLASLKR